MTKPISYSPSEGMSYDPNEEKYWDPKMLQKEIQRAFELCHGCRMCFKYCDSFTYLFKVIDEKYDGDVEKVSAEDTDKVMANCFQCKLCEVQCPYTPREGHNYQLDFPKLVHRFVAIKAREHGVGLREKVLGNPDLAGTMARASFGMANVMNRVDLHRWFMEKILGIHRDKLLPDFAMNTFESWAEKNNLIGQETTPEAVLFQTCYVQNNEPQIGKDAIEVLKNNKVKVTCEKGLQCCGMPKWEHGDLEGLREQAKNNIQKLLPYVEKGAKILAINPTCAMMMRKEYPHLVAQEDRENAQKVANAVMDPCEYLWSIRNEDRFNTQFKSTPGPISYHAPCHLKAQAIGLKGRDMLRKIPGVDIALVSECCGHDGTYAMKTESFEASRRIGQRAFDGMKAKEDAEVWATECPLAAIQFEQHAGKKALHPLTILARAYREDGFPQKTKKES